MDKFTRKTSFEQWFSPISSTQIEKLVRNSSIKLLYKEASHRFILEVITVCAAK
ncbi:hypothetical protein LSPH24S_06994 [Lysinibacillus sphaericus]